HTPPAVMTRHVRGRTIARIIVAATIAARLGRAGAELAAVRVAVLAGNRNAATELAFGKGRWRWSWRRHRRLLFRFFQRGRGGCILHVLHKSGRFYFFHRSGFVLKRLFARHNPIIVSRLKVEG